MSRRPEEGTPRALIALRDELKTNLRLWLRARIAFVVVVAIYVPFIAPDGAFLYMWALLVGFIVTGYIPFKLARLNRRYRWPVYILAFVDMALLTFIITVPNPFQDAPFPAAFVTRFSSEHAYYIFIAASIFSYSPGFVLWNGLMAIVTYCIGIGFLLLQPKTFAVFGGITDDPTRFIDIFLDPNYVDLGSVFQRVLFFLLVSSVLAYAVARFRRLVFRTTDAERARANLSRYFSPTIADALADRDQALSEARSQDVAILFADTVGFTQFATDRAPAEVLATLRDLHRIMATAVFDHEGTLDKYLGDGIMATFGTPDAAPDDAARALACARHLLRDIAAWNRDRVAAGQVPLRVGVGVHFGPTVQGDTGDENRMEYAVIGDAVNVASRIEHLTREMDTDLVVSDDLMTRVTDQDLRDGLQLAGEKTIRGRDGALTLWSLPNPPG